MEEWKDVKGYEGIYQISNKGNVKRIGKYTNQSTSWTSERLLKPAVKGRGYLIVNLSMDNKQSMKHVHRLVAEAFIPNPLNKPTVNHIDGNRSNNNVENLEWSTYLENNIHSIQVLSRDTKNSSDSKVVMQFDLNGKLINEYPSMREAERQTGISGIDKVCAGVKYRKTAGGYIWKYKKDI